MFQPCIFRGVHGCCFNCFFSLNDLGWHWNYHLLPFPGGVFPQGSSWKKRSSNGTNHTSQGGRDPISGKGKGWGKLTKLIRDHGKSGMNLDPEKKHGVIWFTFFTHEFHVKSVTPFSSGASCLALFLFYMEICMVQVESYAGNDVFFSVVVSFKLKWNTSLGRCSQERCRRGYQKQIILKEWWF